MEIKASPSYHPTNPEPLAGEATMVTRDPRLYLPAPVTSPEPVVPAAETTSMFRSYISTKDIILEISIVKSALQCTSEAIRFGLVS